MAADTKVDQPPGWARVVAVADGAEVTRVYIVVVGTVSSTPPTTDRYVRSQAFPLVARSREAAADALARAVAGV
jgi:hypothetical protein